MYALLGISILLAALLTLNALATLLTTGLWQVVAGRAENWSAATRAQVVFALRVFPLLGAMAAVLALLIPSYITHEPPNTSEVVSVKLAVLAMISAIGITLALWRGVASWRATKHLIANWLCHSEPISLDGISIPAYRLNHPFPVIAVVGAFKPRLFIASQIFDLLSADEIAAALSHERGHLATADNFKRSLLRACRHALTIVPGGRSLDRAWAEASEAAADEHAARKGAGVALDLASALVKIARAVPPHSKPTTPAIAFLLGVDMSGVVWRVRRLTEMASTGCAIPEHRVFTSPLALWSSMGAFLVALILTATDSTMLWLMHQAIERMVSVLS